MDSLPEWQKTTANETITRTNFIPGGFSKGYKVFKNLAYIAPPAEAQKWFSYML